MSKIKLLEKYYMQWKAEQPDLSSLLKDLDLKVQKLDEKLSRLESEILDLKKIFDKNNLLYDFENIWIKIKGFLINNSTLTLLNPSKKYDFKIVEITDDYIRIDKLGKINLTKEMFQYVFELLKEKEGWVNIGASVKNTKSKTVEGYLKNQFFYGIMSTQMSASWISAILVKSNIGVIFNNQAIGQAIMYSD